MTKYLIEESIFLSKNLLPKDDEPKTFVSLRDPGLP